MQKAKDYILSFILRGGDLIEKGSNIIINEDGAICLRAHKVLVGSPLVMRQKSITSSRLLFLLSSANNSFPFYCVFMDGFSSSVSSCK